MKYAKKIRYDFLLEVFFTLIIVIISITRINKNGILMWGDRSVLSYPKNL